MPDTETDAPLVILTTLANESDAAKLITALLEQRLVACGTILPARSLYRWEGTVRNEGESLVLLKSRRERWAALKQAVEKSHPYDVPELLALPVQGGLPAYVAWLMTETVEENGEATP